MALHKLWPLQRCSFSRLIPLLTLGAVLAGGCGEDDPCGPLAALCADDGRWVDVATRVHAAAAVDLDGDGELEMVALTTGGRQLAVGDREGWRSMLFLAEAPVGLAALEGEVAVSFSDSAKVAIFGLDDGRLARRRDIALSGESWSLASGDLDGDGRLELVAAVPGAGEVAVIDPRSGDVRSFPAGKAPLLVALGDVDGDARLDVVAHDAGGALQVLRGAGDGALAAARASPASAAMEALVLGDHDGDGDLDAITRVLATSVQVHRNNGAGEFSSPTALPFSGEPASGLGLAVGPAAGGGLVGVSLSQGDGLATWFGKGAAWLGRVEAPSSREVTWVGGGTNSGLLVGGEGFVRPFVYQRGVTPIEVWRAPIVRGPSGATALATADLDGDHLLDVAVVTPEKFHVLAGRADLGLELVASHAFPAAEPLSLAIADVTGDGLPDVVIAAEPGVVCGVGGATGPVPGNSLESTSVAARVLTPLRTGPGSPDVVVAIAADEDVYTPELGPAAVLRFGADGRLVEESPLGEGLGVERVIAVDFDADGVDEPLILADRDGALMLIHATPDGDGYTLGVEHDLAALSGQATYSELQLTRMAAGDVDGDGSLEVMVSVQGGALLLSGLAEGAPTATMVPDVHGPSQLRDVDGDGLLDAVRVNDSWFHYNRGLGGGSFDPEGVGYELPYSSKVALASRPDAQFDLALVNSSGIALRLAREVVHPVAADDPYDFHNTVSELVTADINQDGYDDLVTVSRVWGGGVAVLWGDEQASLARADGFNSGLDNRGLAVGDLDGDGIREVLVSNGIAHFDPYRFWPERVAEWAYMPLGSLERVEDLAITDVDGDGLADIVAIAYIDYDEWNQMSVYVAHGTEEPLEFSEWTRVAAVPKLEKAAVATGDVDGDGDIDLLIRPHEPLPGVLVRATGPRAWAEPETVPGSTAVFTPPAADGGVELITHEGTTIYRHVDGDLERREAIVTHASLVEGALRQVADADGDGRHDFVVFDEDATYVWLRRDDGARRVQLAEVRLAAVQFSDIDGDGRRDLVGLGPGQIFVKHTRR